MIRMFEQHKIRFQKELEGYWHFSPVNEKDQIPSKYEYKMFVPGCWESNIQFCNYRGFGAYKRTIHLEEKSNLRLNFKGVSHTANVYLDGQHITSHYNAYTEFCCLIPNLNEGPHDVVVLVDNTFNKESALHIPNDYYTYGGLIRPVVMELVPEIYIKNIRFTPYYDNGSWRAEIQVKVENISPISHWVKLGLQLDQKALYSDVFEQWVEIGANSERLITAIMPFDDVQPWSNKNPQLYHLGVQLFENGFDAPIDDLIERVGFRVVEVKNQQILLNDTPIFIQGFNRHEDFNIAGCAIPLQLAQVDMDLMTDLGSNAVRTSHYPNDERFLDMCDEQGLYVWEENHARGLELENMQHPNFEKQCADCIREMVHSHYNHPSIIIWGILNECSSDTIEGRGMYAKQFGQIKALDGTRLLSFASNRNFTDLCLDLVDVVSFNLYHAWYCEDTTAEQIENSYIKVLEYIDANGGKDKPIIISEFGAGAMYGYRAPHHPKGSEERQADILSQCLSVYQNRPEIVGTFIWQFCDCKVTDEIWGIKRPRAMNDKGIVDEYRRPKLAYQTVKEIHRKNLKA